MQAIAWLTCMQMVVVVASDAALAACRSRATVMGLREVGRAAERVCRRWGGAMRQGWQG